MSLLRLRVSLGSGRPVVVTGLATGLVVSGLTGAAALGAAAPARGLVLAAGLTVRRVVPRGVSGRLCLGIRGLLL